MGVFLGKVVSIKDDLGGERIKVRLRNTDIGISDENLPYAFPGLPKMLHIKPKVGEMVEVQCVNDDPHLQRFYYGPVISQYQKLYKDPHDYSAGKLLNGKGAPYPDIDNYPVADGAFATDDEIAIYGRKNSDIILSDNDVRIRCGARIYDPLDKTKISFNRENPSTIKLKYHENALSVAKKRWNPENGIFDQSSNTENVDSTASIIAQEINLISTVGDPYTNVFDTKEGISDEDLKKFIEEAHPLPYGDTLIKLLHTLIKAFNNHTHKYSQMKPVPDVTYNELNKFDLESILSKNIKIN